MKWTEFQISKPAHARFVAQNRERRAEQTASLIKRLKDAAAQHGPDSIYAEDVSRDTSER